jgi:apolipoprotein N-acyltransferase
MLKRIAPAICAGLLLALAFPPFNLMFLSFVALAPLLIDIRGKRFWAAFGRGYVCGIFFALPNMFWLEQFVAKWTGSIFYGIIPWILVGAAFSLYFALFAAAASKAWRSNHAWLIPFLWAGVEVLRSTIPFLFFPWSLLGSSLWKTPIFLQPAWWGGPYFLGAWIVLINLLVALFWLKDEYSFKTVRIYVACTVLVFAASILSYRAPLSGKTVRLAAVQPGVDLAFSPKWQRDAGLAANIPKALSFGAALKRDLTVLPEAVSEWAAQSDSPTAPFDLNFAEPTIMGGQRNASGTSYQSMFAFDGSWKFADKTKLVIFGEYVPFRQYLGFLNGFSLPGGDLSPGSEVKTLDVGTLRVGGLLCFEALFEEVARKHATNGAECLAIMSLDDWYQGTGAIDALKAGAILRAVENRIPVARSASLGPSMIIDAKGNIVAQAEIGKTTTAQANVISATQAPIFLRTIFPWATLLSLAVMIALPLKPDEEAKTPNKRR